MVFAAHDGHHRVLRHRDYGLTVKEGRLWAKEISNDVQEVWFSEERGRRKDIKPYRSFDDKAKALRAVKEDFAWTSEARIVEDGEGIFASSIEEGLPLTFAPTEEKVGDDTQACEGVTFCQGTLEGDHLHAAQGFNIFRLKCAGCAFLSALAMEVREEAGSLTSIVAGMDQLPDDRVEGFARMKVLHAQYMFHIVVEGGILAIVQHRPVILIDSRGGRYHVTRRDDRDVDVFVLMDGSSIPP